MNFRGSLSSQPSPELPNQGVYITPSQLIALKPLADSITLTSNQRSRAFAAGATRSRFRGRGMDFAEVRPYQAGDDIRTIDWRVTARTQKPHTKLFQEERERPIFVLLDQRSPMFFGSAQCFKSVYAAELAAVISWAAHNHHDRIGALVFGDAKQQDIRAHHSKHAVLELIHQIHQFNRALQSPTPASNALRLPEMLTEASRIAKPGSTLFIISDFHDFDSSCQEPLSLMAKHCDVMLLHLWDILEKSLPSSGQFSITDGLRRLRIDGASSNLQKKFRSAFNQRSAFLQQSCERIGVHLASVDIRENLSNLLPQLFHQQGRVRSYRRTGRRNVS